MNDILISFVAYLGNDKDRLDFDRKIFCNSIIPKEEYIKINNWGSLKEILAKQMNKKNNAENNDFTILPSHIAILNIIEWRK